MGGKAGAGLLGAFERRLHRLREPLRVQRGVTIGAIARHFPAGTRMNQPWGGMLP